MLCTIDVKAINDVEKSPAFGSPLDVCKLKLWIASTKAAHDAVNGAIPCGFSAISDSDSEGMSPVKVDSVVCCSRERQELSLLQSATGLEDEATGNPTKHTKKIEACCLLKPLFY
mmetsp:Transcript_80696/g.152536  ORF Transcript_80696/g.152536 Transcript_80696/m.152536 type:complete len:115 (+) Transcript_80696:264-608(+)